MEEISFFWEFHFPLEDDDDYEFKKQIFDTGNEVGFDVVIKWSDVFGSAHESPVYLHAAIDATPYNLKKKRSRSGPLDFRKEDTRHGLGGEHDAGVEADRG